MPVAAGLIARDWTTETLARHLQRLGNFARADAFVVAGSARFLSEEYVDFAAEILRTFGTVHTLPTPCALAEVSFACRELEAWGVYFSADLLPPEYHGLEILTPGGALLTRAQREQWQQATARRGRKHRERYEQKIREKYLEALLSRFRRDAVLPPLRLRIHCGFGVAAYPVRWLAQRTRLPCEILEQHRDVYFRGQPPSPQERALRARQKLRDSREWNIFLDPDMRRLAVLAPGGQPVDTQELLLLLADIGLQSGQSMARSCGVSHWLSAYLHRTERRVLPDPLPSEDLSAAVAEGRADAAAEETGLWIHGHHLPVADALFCLLELVRGLARYQGSLAAWRDAIENLVPRPHRRQMELLLSVADARQLFRFVRTNPPIHIGEDGLVRAVDFGELKLEYQRNAWMHFRYEERVGLLRITWEAPTASRARQLEETIFGLLREVGLLP